MIGAWPARSMSIVLMATLAGVFARAPDLRAQQEVHRKVRKEAKPVYPPLARQLHLSGTVRIGAVILANGKVKSTHVIGGNPVLAVAATDAAMHCEFEAADKESTETLEFTFAASEK
jgi:outer membrane biosynthesis protein TonB